MVTELLGGAINGPEDVSLYGERENKIVLVSPSEAMRHGRDKENVKE
jgi:hypothetical protein